MSEVVIIDAVRTPVGRRSGGLSTVQPIDLWGTALKGQCRSTCRGGGLGAGTLIVR